MNIEIEDAWKNFINGTKDNTNELLLNFLHLYHTNYHSTQCFTLDLSSVQNILMEQFISDIMELCKGNVKDQNIEKYLLSTRGCLIISVLSTLTFQCPPKKHIGELAPLMLSLIDYILNTHISRPQTDGLKIRPVVDVFNGGERKMLIEVKDLETGNMIAVFAELINLSNNIACTDNTENNVSVLILAHLIEVLQEQLLPTNQSESRSSLSDDQSQFIKDALLACITSIASAILKFDAALLAQSKFIKEMVKIYDSCTVNMVSFRCSTIIALLGILIQTVRRKSDDAVPFTTMYTLFKDRYFKEASSILFSFGEMLFNTNEPEVKEHCYEIVSSLGDLHFSVGDALSRSPGLADVVNGNRTIADCVENTDNPASTLLFTFALTNSVFIQNVILDVVNKYEVVSYASLKQTFTLLLWNYKQREHEIQCKVLIALEKVVLSRDLIENVIPSSPSLSPSGNQTDLKERFKTFSTDLFDKNKKKKEEKAASDQWSCLSDYCQILRDSNERLIKSLGEHLTLLCSQGSPELRTKLLRNIFLKEINDIGNYFALLFSKSNSSRQLHFANIGISSMILYRDLDTPEMIVTTIMPSLLHLLDDKDRKVLFCKEGGIDSLRYLIQHKVTRVHVLKLYQLLISGEHGPPELLQVSEAAFVSLCGTIMNPPVCELVENIELSVEENKCKMYSDVIKVLLRCSRNESFHLSHFHNSVSQLADHLAVLYAFIGDAHEKCSVEVMGLSLDTDEENSLVVDDKSLSQADKLKLISIYTQLLLDYTRLILGVYWTRDRSHLPSCYSLLSSILFPFHPSSSSSVETQLNLDVVMQMVELCCETESSNLISPSDNIPNKVTIIHPVLLREIYSGIAPSTNTSLCSLSVLQMFVKLEEISQNQGRALQSAGLSVMLLKKYKDTIMQSTQLGEIIRRILFNTIQDTMCTEELKLLLQLVRPTSLALLNIDHDSHVEKVLQALHGSIETDKFSPTHCVSLNSSNQATWNLNGEIRWPSMYHGFSISMWVKLCTQPAGGVCKVPPDSDSDDEFVETLGYRYANDGEGHGNREPIQIISFGHQRFTFVMSANPQKGDLVLSWHGNERQIPHVIHRAVSPDRWHHVVLSYGTTPKQQQHRFGQRNGKVLLWVDGCAVFDLLNAAYPPTVRQNTAFTIGSSYPVESGNIQLSSVLLFQDYMLNRKEICHLMGLSSNSKTLSGWMVTRYVTSDLYNPSSQYSLDLEVTQCFPYYQNIVSEALINNGFDSALLSAHAVTITSLRNHLLLSWAADRPDQLHQYSPMALYTSDIKSSIGSVTQDYIDSHQTLTVTVPVSMNTITRHKIPVLLPSLGGIKVLLMLFATVIENRASKLVQELSLNLIFRCLSHPPLLCEMISVSGYQMLALVLRNTNCVKSPELVNVLVKGAVDGDILVRNSEGKLSVNSNTTAVAKNMYVIRYILLNWKIWETAPLSVWELCCHCIEALVRPSHSNHAYNLQQYQLYKIPKDILLFSQIYELTHKGSSPPRSIISSYMTILYYMIGFPPDLTLLKHISNTLLVSHSRTMVSVHSTSLRRSFFTPLRNTSDMTDSATDSSTGSVVTAPTGSPVSSPAPSSKDTSSSPWSKGVSRISDSSSAADMVSDNQPTSQSSDTSDFTMTIKSYPPDRRSLFSSSVSTESDTVFPDTPLLEDCTPTMSLYIHTLCDRVVEMDTLSNEARCMYYNQLNTKGALLSLVVDVIRSSNENILRKIFKGGNCILEVEQVLVMLNSDNMLTRIACIKLIHTMLHHGSTQVKQHFLKINGYHLISSQIRSHSMSYELMRAIFCLYYPINGSISDGLTQSEGNAQVVPEAVTVILVALESCLTVTGLFSDSLKLISDMMMRLPSTSLDFINFGLIDSLYYTIPLISPASQDFSKSLHALEVLLQTLTIYAHCISPAHYVFEMVWCLCFRLHQENQENSLYERLCCNLLQSGVNFYCNDTFVKHTIKGNGPNKLSKIGSSLMLLISDMPVEAATDVNYDPSSVFAEDIHVNSDHIPNKTSSLSELNAWFISLLNLAIQYIQHRCLVVMDSFTASEETEDWTILTPNDSSDNQHFFTISIFNMMLFTVMKCYLTKVGEDTSPFIQLASANKDKMRQMVARLLLVLYTPRLNKTLWFTVLSTISSPSPLTVLPLLAKGTDKFLQRLHLYTLYVMSDKQVELTSEQTLAAGRILEICQEANLKPPSDVIAQIQYWADQEHSSHLSWLAYQEQQYCKIGVPITILNKSINAHAELITNSIFNQQGALIREFYSQWQQIRSTKHEMQQQWYKVILKTSHEFGVWYNKETYPDSWEIDSTEGPGGIRRRLKRCPMNIKPEFLMENVQFKLNRNDVMPFNYIFQNTKPRSNVKSQITLVHTNKCSHIKPAGCTDGDILLYRQYMLFVRDESSSIDTISQLVGDALGMFWSLADVTEVHKRWFNLRDVAIEVFLNTGQTYLLGFSTTEERDELYNRLLQLNLPNLLHRKDPKKEMKSMTQRWQEGEITNFEYLMHLNKQAGRTFNDLMQYPVLPFILADYKSTTLDLSQAANFRNLGAPMAIQDEKLKERFIQRYEVLKKDYETEAAGGEEKHLNSSTAPYHYGSHYSNSGIVLHYLVRLLPYAKLFIEFQGGSFDIPDRTFHDMKTTWRLASSESTTDVRELIPEFFYLPEMFENNEGFAFGERQNGETVNHVLMPTWSADSPRLFVLTHRMALESEYVSQNLHKWIDLVFGYKQQGQHAIDAINVFHPSTYFGIDVEKIENPIHREAMRTMVKTYGQTPKQLFKEPHVTRHTVGHVQSKPLTTRAAPMQQGGSQRISSRFWRMAFTSTLNDAFNSIERERELKPGTLHFTNPVLCWTAKFPHPIASIRCLPSGEIISLPRNTNYLAFVPWKGPRYEQISSFTELSITGSYSGTTIKWLEGRYTIDLVTDNAISYTISNSEPVTAASVARDGRVFAVGYKSGLVSVWPVNFESSTKIITSIGPARCLTGHLEPITAVEINRAFSVIVTGDSGGTIVIWDLNLMTYVNYFKTRDCSPVTCLCVSDTLGDIVTVSGNRKVPTFPGIKPLITESVSEILLHTVNGTLITTSRCNHRILSVDISVMPEGLYRNIIATGFDNGVIWIWNTWNLTLITEIQTGVVSPILSLKFSYDSYSLAVGTEDGKLIVYTQADSTTT